MNVFVTGATGWVGSLVVKELIDAGHRVTGLARTETKAAGLAATGAKVLRAELTDLEALAGAAKAADAVIHTAFNHDFSRFIASCDEDRRVIDVLGAALEGSDRPLIITSGLFGLPRGADESALPSPSSPRKSEPTARAWADRGVRASTVRLAPSVHGPGDYGFVPLLVKLAREKGVSAYIGDGQNCWSGVARGDAARVYRLAVERGAPERVYHAVADEAVSFRLIAEAIGNQLGLPVEPRDAQHFGWFAGFAAGDMSVSSARTRGVLDWKPEGPGLLDDLRHPAYYA
jgi:nucleoside-diphosphate-sugar epimerase